MSRAVSLAYGGADGWGAARKLVLDAVAEAADPRHYARALGDFFAWWIGQCRPPFPRLTVLAWRVGALRLPA